ESFLQGLVQKYNESVRERQKASRPETPKHTAEAGETADSAEDSDIVDVVQVHRAPVLPSHPPPKSPVVVDKTAQFVDIANKLASMDEQAKAEYQIKSIKGNNLQSSNPSITLEIETAPNVCKRAYIAPAPEGGVVYSIDSSLSNNDSAKVIQNLVKFEVDNAKPGTPLTIPKGPHEKIVEAALKSAIEEKYGPNTCKIENGKCTIPTTPPLKNETQKILTVGKPN
ncbi:MAG: hypothetical protein AB7V32_06290, partial [Candidatus Berkiella sp.]